MNELERAAAYLEGLIDIEKERVPGHARLSLAPIRALLAELGSPERGLPVLHIAGSKGKGSTALFAEAGLQAHGESVGTFTSPHLERWTERFRIGGREVEAARLAAALDRLRPAVEKLRAGGGETVPSFFDATTAAALLLFRDAGVERAIFEVGLGGRLDSTNALDTEVAVVTSIELEHTERLGDHLAAIAAEKAGILKPGVPALCGALAAEALAVVEARALEVGCPLARLGHEIECSVEERGAEGSRVRMREGEFELEVEIAAPGAHQAANAVLAIAALRRLLGSRLDPAALARGIGAAALPGRVEVLSREPWCIVDGAHTLASARALAAVLARIGRPVDFVLSISAGKDRTAILETLLPYAHSLVLTRAEPKRSLDPREIARAISALGSEVPYRVVPNPQLALRAAWEALPEKGALCATGSVYLAGIARRVWRDVAERERSPK